MHKRNGLPCILLVVLCLLVPGCKRAEQAREGMKPSSQVQMPRAADEKELLRFKTFAYVDREGTGLEAFRFLIPASWKFEGGIRWLLDNPGMPAVAGFRVRDPVAPEEFEVFPNQSFFWTNNQIIRQMFPVGSRYFGAEVRRPIGPLEALKRIVLPRFRNKVAGLRIVSEHPLPELAAALGAGTGQPGLNASADGAKIRIEYLQKNILMEEEIYGVVESISFPFQSMTGIVTNTMWSADYLFSFKAEKGKLDSLSKLFQTMVTSFNINPQWFNKYTQVVEYLIKRQIQQIHSVGELSRIISQTSNEISESNLRSYNERQSVYDRVAENFSQHIRGVDEYYDPVEQKPVELPSGYGHAWTNNLGEYVLTDQEDFNPNIGSNLHWQQMPKK